VQVLPLIVAVTVAVVETVFKQFESVTVAALALLMGVNQLGAMMPLSSTEKKAKKALKNRVGFRMFT
jgi:hypothetical protein